MANAFCSILQLAHVFSGVSVCKPDNEKTVIGCESHNVVLDCDNNQIDVISASYGRLDSSTCPHWAMKDTNCVALESLQKVRDKCNKKNYCKVPSTNAIFGDPCQGTYKYLNVTYQCIEDNEKTVIGCESHNVVLDCDNNQIDVISASYGRLDSSTCRHWRMKDTNCVASKSLQKVRDKCNKKNYCKVPSTNAIFGDPCRGTYKYLKVTYQCIESATCGQYAKCHDAATCVNDQCVCTGDLIGDGVTECRPEVKCGKYPECLSNAVCVGYADKKHCECNPPKLGDGYTGCNPACYCRATGDPHYVTFDGKYIDFMGICKYTLSKYYKKGDKCSYSVEVKNENRGTNTRVSYTRLVDVRVPGSLIRLHKGKKVYVNRLSVNLPYMTENYEIKYSGQYVVFKTFCGLEVRFDGVYNAYVNVPNTYSNLMTGICGNCNNDQSDETVDMNVHEVEDDSDLNLSNDSCKPVTDFHPCSERTDPALKEEAEKSKCGILNPDETTTTNPFHECIIKDKDDAQTVFKSCVFDYCAYSKKVDTKIREEVVCSDIASFGDICGKRGVHVIWRTADFCPLSCPPNSHYNPMSSACPATCAHQSAPYTCIEQDVEGCECDDGFVLSNQECIHFWDCGCTDDGKYYPLGAVFVSEDCSEIKECGVTNNVMAITVKEKRAPCGANAMCIQRKEDYICVCKDGFKGDPIKGCSEEVKCGKYPECLSNAVCVGNMEKKHCECNPPKLGDGYTGCNPACYCRATGDPHYVTFDGKYIDFMGICKYTLSKYDKKGDKCSYSVEVKNENRGTNTRVSYTRLVDVRVPGSLIRLHKGKKVYVNRLIVNLPYTTGNYEIKYSGQYVVLKTFCGLEVRFDGVYNAYVNVPNIYSNLMTGICGNCNNDQSDETVDFNVHEVEDDSDLNLINDNCKPVTDFHPCSERTDPALKEEAEKSKCGILNPDETTTTNPFHECIIKDKDDAQTVFKSCVFDYCAYSKKVDTEIREEVVCSDIASFADICGKTGVHVIWRTKDFCPLSCPPNSHYNPTSSACPATCVDQTAPYTCIEQDVEGCECDDGFVLSNQECVHVSECGCTDDGKYYPLGAVFVSDDCSEIKECGVTNNVLAITVKEKRAPCGANAMCIQQKEDYVCVCKDGFKGDPIKGCSAEVKCGKYPECLSNAVCVGNTDKKHCECNPPKLGDGYTGCNPACYCRATGDPHYVTFDGKYIDFMGICKYTLSKYDKKGDKCSYSVEVKNENRGTNTRVSYTRLVDVRVPGSLIRLHKGKKVYVNRLTVNLPYTTENYEIKYSGQYVVFKTFCGLEVRFDGVYNAYVNVPNIYSNLMTGICGNCNNDQSDETVDMNVHEVEDDSDLNLINDNCKPVTDFHPCSERTDPALKEEAEKSKCGILNPDETTTTNPFHECIIKDKDDAQTVFKSCVFDYCAYSKKVDTEIREEVVCSDIASFADICGKRGVHVIWRTEDFCPLSCPPNSHYNPTSSACPATCVDQRAPYTCIEQNVEGCECDDGFVLSNQECVHVSECGCTDDGKYYPLGAVFVSEDCSEIKECSVTNNVLAITVKEKRAPCGANAMCIQQKEDYVCVCKDGFNGDPIKGCSEMCGKYPKCHDSAVCVDDDHCECAYPKQGDGITSCYSVCSCKASGDPHYTTFDGKKVDFMGTCKYEMSGYYKRGDECSFSVEVKNENRNGNTKVSYTRLVDVKVFGSTIRLNLQRRVDVDNVHVNLPYSTKNFKISLSGTFVRVDTKCGLAVEFNGRSIAYVRAPNIYGNDLKGICGNCNGADDETKDFREFEVADDSGFRFEHCKTELDFHPCTERTDPELKIEAEEESLCKHINPDLITDKDPFNDCINNVKDDAGYLFDSCVYDYCANTKNPDGEKGVEEILCEDISVLAKICSTRGFDVRWRSLDLCPLQCGLNSHYSPDTSACPATCVNPKAPETCERPNVEGCPCDDGFIFSDQQCVPVSECGCMEDGKYYPAGQIFVSSDCSVVKQCVLEYNAMKIVELEKRSPCGANAECRATEESTVSTCVCKRSHGGDPIKGCTRVLECRKNVDGRDYQGEVSETASGRKCISWCKARNYKKLGDHNFCRNPERTTKKSPFCYVDFDEWEYCDIPLCDEARPVCSASTTIDCKSENDEFKTCTIEKANYITYVSLKEELEGGMKCEAGFSYGRNGDRIWVDWGCSGSFEICYIEEDAIYKEKVVPAAECKRSQKGTDYKGTWGFTKSGRLCQVWASQYPNNHKFSTKLKNERNYCRNPNPAVSKLPWCYIADPADNLKKEDCDIPMC